MGQFKEKLIQHNGLRQLIKFGIVGVSNTLVTMIVIWVMQQQLHYSPYLSNIIGYVIGVINSYVWNSRWTFGAGFSWYELFKFLLVFGLCYGANLLALYLLIKHTSLHPYISQLIAMLIYNIANFLLNKFVVFKK